MAKPKTLPYEAPEQPEAYSVALHSSAGGADKVYLLSIEADGDLFVVNMANGRRGGTLKPAPVTKAPVDWAEARKLCNAKLFDKVGSGYVPTGGSRFGEGMTAEAIATIARESSGVVPQLSNPISMEDAERYLADPLWCAQIKHDGERRLLIVKGGEPTGGNRKAQTVALPRPLHDAASTLPDAVIDGEQIGAVLHVWDILEHGGADVRDLPLRERVALLAGLGVAREGAISLTETAWSEEEKRAMLARAVETKAEGLVFKRVDAPYVPGRPGSLGPSLKLKFWNSLSAIVSKVNAKRSVALELVADDGSRLAVGNVTVPSNRDIPSVGTVVEIGYLYAYRDGSLFQPSLGPVRTDVEPAECRETQRVYQA